MKRIFTFLVAIAVSLIAQNRTLVEIEAKLFPQILLFDTKIEEKKINNTIVMGVAGEEADVLLFLQTAKENYPETIKGVPIRFVSLKPSEIPRAMISGIVLLDDDKDVIVSVSSIARQKNIVMFVRESYTLSHGGVVSVELSHKIRPVLSAQGMKSHKIVFSSGFITLARIINE